MPASSSSTTRRRPARTSASASARWSRVINRTLGGHVSYDLTDTGTNAFHQVSGGVETLGQWLDARANFYAPVGGQRRLLGSSFAANSGAVFQGQNLMFGGGTQTNSYEYAMSGFDSEVGGKVDALRHGSTCGRSSGPTTSAWTTAPTPGAAGPASRPASATPSPWASASSATSCSTPRSTSTSRSPGRRSPAGGATTAATARRCRPTASASRSSASSRSSWPAASSKSSCARQAALDPFTGAPLVFLHVAPGGNSDGSFENPYATLDKAFRDPRFAAGNVIVYDRTQGIFTGNVTLAPGTRLLSAGPLQTIDTLNGGKIVLPFSGADPTLSALPQIQGTVTMSSGTTLSGFRVTGPAPGNGPGRPTS